jgi:GNAT superfamily N-acetyltransferase
VLALVDAEPAGVGGVTIAGTTARLWDAGVVPHARGRGIYRAVLAARLGYAVEHGATMALVKGRTDTSAPILRRAGFTAYGEERTYRVSL